MPKKSRHRKGFILGKRITTTRKIRGGKQEDLTKLKAAYKSEVSLSWFKNRKESKVDISLYIAKSRAHIENLIVKSTLDLASKMSTDINTTGTPSAKALGQPQKTALDVAITNYNSAISKARTIGLTNPPPIEAAIEGLGPDVKAIVTKVATAGDTAHDKLSRTDPLPLEGELFNTAM